MPETYGDGLTVANGPMNYAYLSFGLTYPSSGVLVYNLVYDNDNKYNLVKTNNQRCVFVAAIK